MENLDVTLEVITPKGKAEKSSKTFAKRFPALLGKKPSINILNDNTFRMTFHNLDEKQRKKLMTKSAVVEVGIKSFYKQIIKLSSRVNRLGTKFKWGIEKIKKRFAKEYKKLQEDKSNSDFENMSNEEFKEFLNFDDIEEIKELMTKELVRIVENVD
jgi:hypothetical protein